MLDKSSRLAHILDGEGIDPSLLGAENIRESNSSIIAAPFISTGEWDVSVASMANTTPKTTLKTTGICIECEDQPIVYFCSACEEELCAICFHFLHRKGNRSKHPFSAVGQVPAEVSAPAQRASAADAPDAMDVHVDESLNDEKSTIPNALNNASDAAQIGQWFRERAKFIPVRLSLKERQYLLLLEAALSVSNYTDKIDILSYGDKTKGMVYQIKELCAVLSGLLLSADYKAGQELFETRDFEANATFYQALFEIGRRHKIMNPEKMRDTYGKLMYLLQDSQKPHVAELLGFSCVIPIRNVSGVLEEAGALSLLDDPLLPAATMEIKSEGRQRYAIQKDIKTKERAIETLATRYSKGVSLNREAVKQLVYSIGDNFAFLGTHRDPCDTMIRYLKEFFDPANSGQRSLAIHGGYEGARLSHSHEKQFNYVYQSLSLWREILHEMFMLCSFAEDDLLDPSMSYRLMDTGQGLNRVQYAPKVSRVMHNILHRAQKRVGHWVGSSVIHLGDVNVPNAFLFLDKYTQIYRILKPITTCLGKIDDLAGSSTPLAEFIQSTFGGDDGPREAKAAILTDFFRHGFDGSGADNFNSAGSCIDGRLTSAWNWCNQLEKKVIIHGWAHFPL